MYNDEQYPQLQYIETLLQIFYQGRQGIGDVNLEIICFLLEMLVPVLHGLNYFFLISKKTNLHVQHAFLSFLAVVGFERLQCSFVRLKRQTSYLHIILLEELSYVLTKDFVSSVHVCFFVHSAHFHLACRLHFLFSHRRYEIFMFFFLRNSSPLFSILRSSSVSVIHVRVNIRNNVKKGTTFFFLSLSLKVRAAMR